ncbi:hypothetical protein CBOM_07633 [Ceraceosorus bombacis]|uniref:Uncharacterized protein n=1 Tax=Ceraceosorus bombacis TaxID=401625 RepID=A0A0N7LAL8_9BASI|nr:hypothetical protein CBOM_07633 [Ceraceosorus bombacis]
MMNAGFEPSGQGAGQRRQEDEKKGIFAVHGAAVLSRTAEGRKEGSRCTLLNPCQAQLRALRVKIDVMALRQVAKGVLMQITMRFVIAKGLRRWQQWLDAEEAAQRGHSYAACT